MADKFSKASEPSKDWRELVFGEARNARRTVESERAEESWVRGENALRPLLAVRLGADNYSGIQTKHIIEASGVARSTFYQSMQSVGRVASSIVVRDLADEILAIRESLREGDADELAAMLLASYLETLVEYGMARPEQAMAAGRAYGSEVAYQWVNARKMGQVPLQRRGPWHPAVRLIEPITELLSVVRADGEVCASIGDIAPCESEYAGYVMGAALLKGTRAAATGVPADISTIHGLEAILST